MFWLLGCFWVFAQILLWWKLFYFLIVTIMLLFSFRRTSWFQKKLWAPLLSWRKFDITQQPASPWPHVITHSTWVIEEDIRNYLQCWSIWRELAGGNVRDLNRERKEKKLCQRTHRKAILEEFLSCHFNTCHLSN